MVSQEEIKALKEFISLNEDSEIKIARSFLEDVIDYFNSRSKIGKWIPCSEEMPEKNGYYLVSRCDSLVNQIPTEVYPAVLYFEKPKIWLYSPRSFNMIENYYVIAWQSLPPVYIKQSKNGNKR